MPEYTVGEGVRYEMERQADRPASHEVFLDPNMSQTFGEKYVYLYNAADGKVRVLDPKQTGR
jgi:hypothetical protein